MSEPTQDCTAFAGTKCVASGDLGHVVRKSKEMIDSDERAQVLIFDDTTSDIIEVDFRGTTDDVLRRITGSAGGAAQSVEPESRGPGRPKLGVIAREVTLLPRHWDWLASQPGGASVTLRRLVELARKENQGRDRQRQVREAAYRFLSAMAGDFPGFEEAARALFAGDGDRFMKIVKPWPRDVREHAVKLAEASFTK
jgi:uncharacterized protein